MRPVPPRFFRASRSAAAWVLGVGVAFALTSTSASAAERPSRALIEAGERLYLEGQSRTGTPIRAQVAGGVERTGAQVACAACHGRSGLTSIEAGAPAAPIAAPFLEAPRKETARARPGYGADALARALRDGVDPGGNRLDPRMPRYRLEPADEAALGAYLGQLSRHPSPGASDAEVRFATVIAPGADPDERAAMLAILRAFFRTQTAHGGTRRGAGGRWSLDVWELKGPPSGWQRQLEAKQRARPVFALVSGLGHREWGPVHRFCERERIACLLPNVDAPPSGGWYSLYFSGGLTIEAATLDTELAAAPRVVQVLVRGSPGEQGAAALTEARALRGRGADEKVTLTLTYDRAPTSAELALALRERRASAAVLWLTRSELSGLDGRALGTPIYLSSTLLGNTWESTRVMAGPDAWVAHPYALSKVTAERFARTRAWLASQQLASTPALRRIQDQTLLAAELLGEGMRDVKKTPLRELLLERLDRLSDDAERSSSYPTLRFGPGQRTLSKGCYLIPPERTGRPAEWRLSPTPGDVGAQATSRD